MEAFKRYLQESIENAKTDLVTSTGDSQARQEGFIEALEAFQEDFEEHYEEFIEEVFKFSEN